MEERGCARVSGAELFLILSPCLHPPTHTHGWLSADHLQMGLGGEGEEGERCGWEKWVTRAEMGGVRQRETGERDRSENYSNGVRWGEEEGVGGTKRVRGSEGGGRKRGSNSLVEKEWISHRPFFPFI